MSSMSAQIVFLVDTYQGEDTDDESRKTLANSLCLACLRLLTHLTAKLDKKASKQRYAVKWGFKFFSSKSSLSKIEKHEFKEFKLKYFEDFESKLCDRLKGSTNHEQSSKKSSKSRPSDCVSKALTELIGDFLWEKPDITSPVRGRKSEMLKSCTNLVFLLSHCPKTAAQMKYFTGKQVPDDEVFLDSLLSPALFRQFSSISKLSLFWIDTDRFDTPQTVKGQNQVDIACVEIVEETVGKCKGRLIPLQALVRGSSPYLLHITAIVRATHNVDKGTQSVGDDREQKKIEAENTFLSTTSVLDFYLNMSTEYRQSQTSTVSKLSAQLHLKDADIQLTLMKTSSQEPVSMATKTCWRTCPADLDKATKQLYTKYLEDPFFLCKGTPVKLHTYAVLSTETLPHGILGSVCYTCVETPTTSGTPQQGGIMGHFRDTLTDLAKNKSLLVLYGEQIPYLFVLEPLTVTMATIKAVHLEDVLLLEKCVLRNVDTDVAGNSGKIDETQYDVLIQRLVNTNGGHSSTHLSSSDHYCPEKQRSRVGHQFDGCLLDRWHIPGCRSSLVSLIDQLNQKISTLEYLSTEEESALKNLQQTYKNAPKGFQPLTNHLVDLTAQDPSVLDTSGLLDISQCKLTSDSGQAVRKSGRVSISTRTDMIMHKSREVVAEREHEKKTDSKDQSKDVNSDVVTLATASDFKNEEELKEYLTSMYRRVVSGEVTGLESSIQTMVTVVSHYMQQSNATEPEMTVTALLEDSVVLSAQKLREKYATIQEEGTDHTAEKVREYQIQVLLALEMTACLVNKDQTVEDDTVNQQVVALLRTLSFITEPSFLSKFMQNCLLYNYMHTIPKTLANIYDELMQPLPEALAAVISPDNSLDESSILSCLGNEDGGPPSARTRSQGPNSQLSSQPNSNNSLLDDCMSKRKQLGRKLVHHPSLADFGPKRQIVVEVAKPKTSKDKENTSEKRKLKKAKEKTRKSLFKAGTASVVGRVKLERRQSVAVMERSHRTPKKSKSKLLLKSPGNSLKSPGHKVVTETPCHKQVSQALWRRQENERRVSDVAGTNIVEESPEKPVSAGWQKDTPTKGKRAKAILRRSFYSAGPVSRTRNLTKYFQLADRIAGRQKQRHESEQNKLPKLLTLDPPAEFQSPDKNSSFLMSQFMPSPSPAKGTPRKSSTKTPSKLLTESPSMNTRSQRGSAFKLNQLNSPSHYKSQSSGLLVADSSTKSKLPLEHTTPTKSPVCGVVTFGLDSPQNSCTTKVNSVTPTRRSVRAALFARSPATSRYASPRERRGSPQTLLHRFNSPAKLDSDGFLSPGKPTSQHAYVSQKAAGSDRPSGKDAGTRQLFMSPRKRTDSIGRADEVKADVKADDKSDIFKGRAKQGPDPSGLSKDLKSEVSQKTPSPKKKIVNKTPDSFDKWHRRKPVSSKSSSVTKKQPVVMATESLTPSKATGLNVDGEVSFKVKDEAELERLSREPVFVSPRFKSRNAAQSTIGSDRAQSFRIHPISSQNPLRRKRSLLFSPEKTFSPSKRQRTSVTQENPISLPQIKSLTSSQPGCSQSSGGFDVSGGSFSMLSQGSVEFLSSTSMDDVFVSDHTASQNLTDEELGVSELDSSVFSSRRFRPNIKVQESDRPGEREMVNNVSSPTRTSLNLPEDVNVKWTPSSRRVVREGRSRGLSGDSRLAECVNKETKENTNGRTSSPCCLKSPSGKLYSPAVSAKSLMHLINSPLVPSSVSEGINSSPGEKSSHSKVGDRSRRSLKLQN